MKAQLTICLLFAGLLLSGNGFSQESRIEKVTFDSQVLGISRTFNIYLPPGYDNSSERYPVLYLFRGHEDEWLDRDEDVSRNNRNIQDIADQLIAEGSIGPLIIVMPGLFIDGGVNTLGLNFLRPDLISGAGSGQFLDYLVEELIPKIDNDYRTLAYGSQRATDGFSAGGRPAMLLATKFPHLFSSVGAYDGTMGAYLDLDDPGTPGPLDDPILTNPFANPVFGIPPRDVDYIKSLNTADLIYYAEGERRDQLLTMQFLLHTVSPQGNVGLRAINFHILEVLESVELSNGFADMVMTPNALHNWFYADQHMLLTLPLHWQKFQNPVNTVPLRWISPGDGERLSGTVEIKWSPGASTANATSILAYSREGRAPWLPLATISSGDTTYLWDTASVPDGTRYRLQVTFQGDSSFAIRETEGGFTIDNPGNGVPEIEINPPGHGEVLSGSYTISWYGGDADGDPLHYSMNYSPDNGANWFPLFSNLETATEYDWNTVDFENGRNYRLAARVSDGSAESSDTTLAAFEVFNERQTLPSSAINQVSGISNAMVTVQVVNAAALTGDQYRITFDDSSFPEKVYQVENSTRREIVVEHSSALDGVTEGPLFDGIRLLIRDYREPIVNADSTGWKNSDSDLEGSVFLPTINLGGTEYVGVPYPADYSILVADQVIDTSSTAFGAPAIPIQFTVRNITEEKKAEVIFFDTDGDQAISRNDVLYIIEADENGEAQFTWAISFSGPPNAVVPQAGDLFQLSILKPLTAADVYEFIGSLTAIGGDERSGIPRRTALHQNYPNPFNPVTTIRYNLASVVQVQLTIYNILGQEVRTLVDERQNAGEKSVIWDGRDDTGNSVSTGIYIYRIRAGDFLNSRKMVLMR